MGWMTESMMDWMTESRMGWMTESMMGWMTECSNIQLDDGAESDWPTNRMAKIKP